MLWTAKRRPFRFARGHGWNTTSLVDGWHRLTLRAYGPRGYTIRRDLRVRVVNPAYALRVQGVDAGETVAAATPLWIRPTAATKRVALEVDGQAVAVETAAPFTFDWDPSDLTGGAHELRLTAEAWDGRTTVATVPVEVAHPLAAPVQTALLDSLADA